MTILGRPTQDSRDMFFRMARPAQDSRDMIFFAWLAQDSRDMILI